jgi:site-specific recombinase XerD
MIAYFCGFKMRDLTVLRQPETSTEIIQANHIHELMAQWQFDLQEVSPATRSTYQRGANLFFEWLAWQGSADVSGAAVREWIKDLQHRDYSPGSVNTWLAGLRSLFAWAHEQGYIPFNPVMGVRGARRRGTTRAHKRDELTAAEVLAVFKTCDESSVGKRDLAILSLMAYAALRQTEIHRANVEDLRTKDDRLVLWVQGKGSADKDDFVVLSPAAERALRGWLSIHPTNSGAMFVSLGNRNNGERLSLRTIRQIVKRRYSKAGIVGFQQERP